MRRWQVGRAGMQERERESEGDMSTTHLLCGYDKSCAVFQRWAKLRLGNLYKQHGKSVCVCGRERVS